MIHIDRMRIQLPEDFKHRGSSIARMVGESLAEIHPSENHTLDKLSISPVRVSINATDRDIAHSIVNKIALTIGEGK